MGWMFDRSAELVPGDETLKDGSHPTLEDPRLHAVLSMPITGLQEDGQEVVCVGIGCYWGVEKLFQETPGVLSTSVEFAGGVAPNPTHRESCTGCTSHTEIVEVVYSPEQISFDQLIVKALEVHDPTQGHCQGNDVGTQYRSVIYTTALEQAHRAQEIADAYVPKLADVGLGAITTEIKPLSETPTGEYHRAEDGHRQYLFKNPNGYCPVHSIGMVYGI